MSIRRQGVYWFGTIKHECFTPYQPPGVEYIRGQLEQGGNTDYLHWQVVIVFSRKQSLRQVKEMFGEGCGRFELSRSKHADEYVWKEETRVEGTQFELGCKPIKRNDPKDWDRIKSMAKSGDLESIPSDVFVLHYRSLCTIRKDYMQPCAHERRVFVFWGRTGTGKSRRAWEEAGLGAFPKDPRTKFWDGYRDQENVVIDEFRGSVDIAHLLRWFDRYPCIVETKGSATVLLAKSIWITSNIAPHQWYAELDGATMDALMRRLEVTEFE